MCKCFTVSHVDVLITPSDGFPTQPLLGTNTRLNCSVTLHPQLNPSILTIQHLWSSNGVQRGSGHELTLSDLSPADATTYSCQVMILLADPGQAMMGQISNESNYTLVIKSELCIAQLNSLKLCSMFVYSVSPINSALTWRNQNYPLY